MGIGIIKRRGKQRLEKCTTFFVIVSNLLSFSLSINYKYPGGNAIFRSLHRVAILLISVKLGFQGKELPEGQ